MKTVFIIFLWLILGVSIFSQSVYTTKSGKKYHTVNCSYMRSSSFEINLQDAVQQGYEPCKRCNPPVLESSPTSKELKNNVPNTTTKKKTDYSGSKRCIAITKKGSQCKRDAKSGSNYCWQHSK